MKRIHSWCPEAKLIYDSILALYPVGFATYIFFLGHVNEKNQTQTKRFVTF